MIGAEYGFMGICIVALAGWIARREKMINKLRQEMDTASKESQEKVDRLHDERLNDYKEQLSKNVLLLSQITELLDQVVIRLDELTELQEEE